MTLTLRVPPLEDRLSISHSLCPLASGGTRNVKIIESPLEHEGISWGPHCSLKRVRIRIRFYL